MYQEERKLNDTAPFSCVCGQESISKKDEHLDARGHFNRTSRRVHTTRHSNKMGFFDVAKWLRYVLTKGYDSNRVAGFVQLTLFREL